MDNVPTINGVAVYLPAHCDDFGKPGRHYHIDWRYHKGPAVQSQVFFTEEEPVYLPMEKVREEYVLDITSTGLILGLSERYDCLINGRCPHHGLPIVKGQCTGHGLVFKDGKLVKDFWYSINGVLLKATHKRTLYTFIFDEPCAIKQMDLVDSDGNVWGTPLKQDPPINVLPGDLFKVRINHHQE